MSDLPISVIAARQHGCVSLNQLRELGITAAGRRHLVVRGRVEQLSLSVFRIAGSAPTPDQGRMAAVLDAGPSAALSHDSAAAAWGFGRDRSGTLQVVRTRHVTPRESHLAHVHVVRDLRAWHVVARSQVEITTPARVIVDLAATSHRARVEHWLDAAWSKRLLGIGEVANVVRDVRRKGRSGVVLLDELIDARKDLPRPGSALEMRFADILRRHGLPEMRRQVHLSDDEGWIGCADFVGVDAPVVVFVDGAAFHTSGTDQRHDDGQTSRIRAIGYHVERISDAQILFAEHDVVSRLRPLLLVRDRAA